ncbi:hypothetical protein OHS33_25795 [Streptomyces sp. NBC_00536]|uniref:hypothetical protein n=1 Tax=Streptomyces sp. NBC_00536 TaxID=2975769 RepID=UPI002E7FC525|nr:hypothetical protein [Streptomyces sp. NBC_00536]WUC81448.1 hypothetical protein OHS33_25795 [Streptomyces sp. NBC_00536]
MFVYEIAIAHRDELIREAAEYRQVRLAKARAARRGFSLKKAPERPVSESRSRFTPAA